MASRQTVADAFTRITAEAALEAHYAVETTRGCLRHPSHDNVTCDDCGHQLRTGKSFRVGNELLCGGCRSVLEEAGVIDES